MLKDPFYHLVIGFARTLFSAQDLRFNITGTDNVPPSGGAVVVVNHTGYLDFAYTGIPFRKYKRYVRFMAKAEVFDHPVAGPMMRAMKHIPVDRIDGTASYHQAIDALRRGELVGIFPEATVSRSFEVKTLRSGAVRMAQEAGVPIIAVLIVGSQRVWTKGHKKNLGRSHTPIEMMVLPPWHPEGDPEEQTRTLHSMMDAGVKELWERYERNHGPLPRGAYWVPARLGGGAPTLSEAQVQDDEIQGERQRVRRLRDDMNALAAALRAASITFVEKGKATGSAAAASADRAMTKAKVKAADKAADKAAEKAHRAAEKAEKAAEKAQETAAKAASSDSTRQEVADTIAAIKQSLDALAVEATASAKEGAAKIAQATEHLKEATNQLQTQFARYADEVAGPAVTDALNQIVAQTKQIRDRLPSRIAQRITDIPAAVVTDVDGTIFIDGQVGEPTRQVLADIVAAGATHYLATGRPIRNLPPVLASLGTLPTVVCCNGAAVYDTARKKVLHVDGFSPDALEQIRTTVATVLPEATIETDEVEGQIVKLAVFADLPSKQIAAALEEPCEGIAQVTYSMPHGHAELSPWGVNKATGLHWLLQRDGVDPAQVVAFGDMPNDLEMLDFVGCGIAMGNADPRVIVAAQWVTNSVDKDGVAEALRPVLERS